MSNPLYPRQWYWLADDNRVYSAPLQSIVTTVDQGYQNFLNSGLLATRWPPDISNQQTNASLNSVINPLGLYIDLKSELYAYAGDKRWRTETAGIMCETYPIKTDADSQRKTATLHSDFVNGIRVDPVEFKLADGSFITADAILVADMYGDMQAHIATCYATEKNVHDAIARGDVTTHQAVDDMFATIPVLP